MNTALPRTAAYQFCWLIVDYCLIMHTSGKYALLILTTSPSDSSPKIKQCFLHKCGPSLQTPMPLIEFRMCSHCHHYLSRLSGGYESHFGETRFPKPMCGIVCGLLLNWKTHDLTGDRTSCGPIGADDLRQVRKRKDIWVVFRVLFARWRWRPVSLYGNNWHTYWTYNDGRVTKDFLPILMINSRLLCNNITRSG